MRTTTEPSSRNFSTELGKYLKGISAFVTMLATIYVITLFYFDAYGALMLNGVATALIMATTFCLFHTGRTRTAEIFMSIGGSIVIGVYCYKSPESANPSALLVLSAMQAPLYMAHLSLFWNALGIIIPIILYIVLQQPGSHSPGISPLELETQALLNSIMISSCAIFIAMAGAIGMRRFIALRDKQREREVQMIQTSKLASLGEMAAGIAHEINNPLAIIEGYAWMMRRTLENKENINPDEFLKSVNVLFDTTKRITSIVSGMRKFTREASQDPLDFARVDSLIQDATVLCNSRIKKCDANLTIMPSPILDLEILTSPVHVTQVLVNLLQNAADATSELKDKQNRSIIISCSEPSPDLINIMITDNGNGIPPAIAQKMFDPFFTTKEVGHGTGLGLSISKALMENLGGTLTYSAESGQTRFTITIPKDPTKQAK